MRAPKILVVYKKSAYQTYFHAYRHPRFRHAFRSGDENLAHFKKSHEIHEDTLRKVRLALDARGLAYHWISRGKLGRNRYDFILTVGGDGTVLEAARYAHERCVLLGVNSDPGHSVGRLCAANARSFEAKLDKLLSKQAPLAAVHRLRLRLDGRVLGGLVLNDVLIAHSNPAAMSHYVLEIGRSCEQQRSSGIWISTAAGSTGGAHSAGGRLLPIDSKKYQYVPRELYSVPRYGFHLKGGVLSPDRKVRLRSLMREGRIYVDGAHRSHAFGYGSALEVENAGKPLSLFHP